MNKDAPFGKIIIPCGVFPERHELETVNFFAAMGKDIEFIKPSEVKKLKNPDIQMDGVIWEMKVPTGHSKRTIENNYRTAENQSRNIIFDLRRIKIDEKTAISQIQNRWAKGSRKVSKILIITKNEQMLDLRKKK
jgi:hypothetical protein